MIFEIGAPPAKPDQKLMSSLKVTDWCSYTRNPQTTKRNQVENTRTAEKAASLKAPKFLSEKAREPENNASGERRISDVTDAIEAAALSIPVMYHNHEIKYSKFGIEDFDFGSVVL
jgi:PAB-dependent poly(A)-specific ribonuclease subunit 2